MRWPLEPSSNRNTKLDMFQLHTHLFHEDLILAAMLQLHTHLLHEDLTLAAMLQLHTHLFHEDLTLAAMLQLLLLQPFHLLFQLQFRLGIDAVVILNYVQE